MKKIILLAVAALVASAAPGSAQTYRGDVRESRQEHRIIRGAVQGDLTGRETRRLLRQQDRVDRAQHRAGRDGHVTRREANRIERLQDRASRNIARKSNNGRYHY